MTLVADNLISFRLIRPQETHLVPNISKYMHVLQKSGSQFMKPFKFMAC